MALATEQVESFLEKRFYAAPGGSHCQFADRRCGTAFL